MNFLKRNSLAVSVAAMVLLVTMLLTPVSALSSHAEAQAAAYNRHSIGMTGIGNARELGGYQTVDGHTVKFGKLLRCGKMVNATEEDKARLVNIYHLSKIIDFRTNTERTKDPDPVLCGIPSVHLSVLGDSMQKSVTNQFMVHDLDGLINLAENGMLDNMMVNLNRMIVTEPAAINAYKQFFQELLAADGKTVLWHCSAGKDRAGLGSALVLTALGVDRETVYADYLNTNYYYASDIQSQYNKVLKATGSKTIAGRVGTYEGVQEHWLKTAFDTIEKEYGSVDNFFHDQLSLSDSDLQALRDAYLQESILR